MNTKLIKYLASTGALLGIVNQSEAIVIYTDINPDTSIIGKPMLDSWDCFAIDMDNDGNKEFDFCQNLGLQFQYSGSSYYQSLNNPWGELVVLGSNDVYMAANTTTLTSLGSMTFTGRLANFYSYSKAIDSNNIFYSVGAVIGTAINISNQNTLEKYLSVKFKINNQFHFGWIRIQTSIYSHFGWLDVPQLTIHDYAYESVANAPIKAGQKSGGVPDAIESDIENQFNIYSKQNIVFIKSELSNYNVVITDVSGKKIINQQSNNMNTHFPISENGIYFITLISGEESFSKKVKI